MQNTIRKQYIRNPKTNEPQGVVVLVKDEGKFLFGYSLCSPRDRFNKKMGTAIALARATHPEAINEEVFYPDVPERKKLVENNYKTLEERAIKYFKL
jgi:hypothetical protein